MWYEWEMFYQKTRTPKSSTYIILPLFLSSTAGWVARSIHWHQSSTQKDAHPWRRMRICSVKFDDRLFAYRSAHFGAKTSAWHWGRVSGALLRLLHSLIYFRHAGWVYVDDFFLLFPKSTSAVQFTLAIILLRTHWCTSFLEEVGIR